MGKHPESQMPALLSLLEPHLLLIIKEERRSSSKNKALHVASTEIPPSAEYLRGFSSTPSSQVIVLTVVFAFILGVSWLLSVGDGFRLMEWALSQLRQRLFTPTSLVPPSPAYL